MKSRWQDRRQFVTEVVMKVVMEINTRVESITPASGVQLAPTKAGNPQWALLPGCMPGGLGTWPPCEPEDVSVETVAGIASKTTRPENWARDTLSRLRKPPSLKLV
jgi:hypothetical protein